MISSLLVLAFMAAPQDATIAARQRHGACISAFLKKSIDAEMKPEDFEAALAGACAAEEAALKNAIIQRATRAGDSRALGERDAADELDYVKGNTIELFRAQTKTATPQS